MTPPSDEGFWPGPGHRPGPDRVTGPDGSAATPSPDDDAWGPQRQGGRGRRLALKIGVVVVALAVLGGVAASFVGWRVAQVTEENISRVAVPDLAAPADDSPLNVLVVGSDSRDGLTDEDRVRYTLGLPGETSGQRSDTLFLVSIPQGRGSASIVSFPRDLRVEVDGRVRKLTETFDGGPSAVVGVIEDTLDIKINHYVEVSVLGFIGVVDALGDIELCLELPLRDDKSGVDLPDGCSTVDAKQALGFVRSRSGARGDYQRIERQQQFMRAVLARLVSTRTLVDVPKLLNVVSEVAGNVTADEGLGVGEMRSLAAQLRDLADGEIPMISLPSHPQDIGGISYDVVYPPGVRAIGDRLRAGEPLASRGEAEERAAISVAVWTGGDLAAADEVISTLHWAGFPTVPAGRGPGAATDRATGSDSATSTDSATPQDAATSAGPAVVVHPVAGFEDAAGWVAAQLGAEIVPLPDGVAPPDGATVVVELAG